MTAKSAAQKQIAIFLKKTYFDSIPLSDLFDIITSNGGTAVQEDGTPWSGLLCGEEGRASIQVVGIKSAHYLIISWYKMPSGRWEVVGYLS